MCLQDRLAWVGPFALPGVELLPYPSTFETPTVLVPASALCSMDAQDMNPRCGLYTFHLIVSKLFTPQGQENPRQAHATAAITVVSGSPPEVKIDWQTQRVNKILMKQNEADPLRMVGSVTPADPDSVVTIKWYMLEGDLVGAEGSLDDLRVDGRMLTDRADTNMVLNDHVLTPGAIYKFALQATDVESGSIGMAEIEIKVNTPPAGGGFWVQPDTGKSLDTYFYLNASMWNDEATDYPITYDYSFESNGARMPIGESRLTAAIPVDNPCCSCRLTRVRSRCRRDLRAELHGDGDVPGAGGDRHHQRRDWPPAGRERAQSLGAGDGRAGRTGQAHSGCHAELRPHHPPRLPRPPIAE